jgi:putative ABC transport system permease protein
MVWSKLQGHRTWVSASDFNDWERQNTTFQDLNAWSPADFSIVTQDHREFAQGMVATPGYCTMLGNPLSAGRNFLPDEGEPGKEHVVILSHRLWQRLVGNSQIVGQKLRINGAPYKVVGVMAPGAADRRDAELIVPLVFKNGQLNRDSRSLLVTGRLKPGVTIQQAQTNIDTIMARIAQDYPKSNKGVSALVEPLKNDFLPADKQLTLWLLLGAGGFLLLIACLNVANLLLAKGMARQREVAIRSSLGATRAVIFAQCLTESVVLATLGGIVGISAGYVMLRGLVAVMPPHFLPAEADLHMNVPVLLFTLAATALAGMVFGSAPAWYASRVDPAEILKEGGRAGIGVGRRRLRRVLVVGEYAMAVTLLAGAGLAIRSFWNLTHIDLGMRTDHVVGFYLIPDESRWTAPEQIQTYYRRVLSSIETVPGVVHVSAMTYLPLEGLHYTNHFTIAGKPANADLSVGMSADLQQVTPAYFQTFGIRIAKGRAFTDHDNSPSTKVAMVNEEFANRFLKGMDPLQQRIVMRTQGPGPAVDWRIVGVFHTVKSRGFREDAPEIDIPFWQDASPYAGIGVRTAEDPASMMRAIRAAVNAVDPEIPLAVPRTMDQVRDEVLINDRFTMILFSSFAITALLLATVGIYGVMAFSVTQRSHEIAVRIALGATRNGIVGLLLKEGVVLACAGLGFGFIGARLVGKSMKSILFGTGAVEFSVFALVGLVLMIAAILACYFPALRAASAETMQALKTE